MSTIPLYFIALAAVSAPFGRGEVLDFSARWCGPCQQMAPIVASLEREGLPIRAVDVDAQRDLAQRFGINQMPTFVLVIDGQEVARHSGMMSEQQLRSWIAKIPQSTSAADEPARAAAPRSSTPYVADERVRLGSPQAFAAATSAPARPAEQPRQPDAVAEVRPAPQRESVADRESHGDKGSEPRRGLWPFGNLARGASRSEPQTPPAVRANDSLLSDASGAAEAAPGGSNPMSASVRLRVTIDGKINLGSGTIIDCADGAALIVTCGHIFRGFQEQSRIEVNTFHGDREESYSGRLVKYDLEADVGLLAIEARQPLSTAAIGRDLQVAREQENVISIGCSGGQPPSRENVIVTAVNPYLGPENLECTGIPVQGRSGGGLFRESGELVGICIAADPARKRGVYASLTEVHKLLDQAGLAHLFRVATPPAVALDSDAGLPAGTSAPFPGEAPTHSGGGQPGSGSLFDSVLPTGNLPARESLADAGGTPPTAAPAAGALNFPTGSRPVKLGPATDDAEIVCIIRPRNQPQAASQVVIIHQASPKMLSYLRGELGTSTELHSAAGGLLSHETWPNAATPAANPAAASEAAIGPAYSRVSATLANRPTDLSPTVYTAPAAPRRYVRTRPAAGVPAVPAVN